MNLTRSGARREDANERVADVGRRERPVDPAAGPLQAFAHELRELRRAAGSPSYRELALRAYVSDTSLSVAASGTRLPSLEVTLGYVHACGGDAADWERRWLRTARLLGAVRPDENRGPDRRYEAHALAGAMPAQLPCAVAEFTGRASQLRRLDALLARPEPAETAIALITGTPGVGKTALAVHWARRNTRLFADGQLYVNLRGYAQAPPVRPIDALGQLLRGLGVDSRRHPVELDEAAALFRTLLGGRRILVVLDNAASSDQVRPLLPGNPACAVMVTSRNRLDGLVACEGARRVELDVLPAAESLTLLARMVGTDRLGAEPAAAAALAELCAHLPLALRIAASNLVNNPHRSVGGLAAELEQDEEGRLSVLDVGGDAVAAVAATFDLSYSSLPAVTRRTFRHLGLAPGPDVTAEITAVLAGTDRHRAAEELGRLASAHLVSQYAPGRYRCHDLLRLYARLRAAAEESDRARQATADRLLDFYLRMAGSAASRLYPHLLRLPSKPRGDDLQDGLIADHRAALEWLDAERPNLLAAIRHGSAHGQPRPAWLLADALRGYFALRRTMVDWLAAAQTAREAAESAGDQQA
ncbi:MAG TPA: NB-ARC domain-containing protein, partial [Thermoanaerobaculia bacterium]|nr:NB-ARC domain-containing protein [Thermoanaerobaculia bacterium]